MASIEITNENKINVNVNDGDSWSLNVNNSNFMLKKYNGIGPSTSPIELKTFSNVGELFGEIELFVNGKLCDNYDIKQINSTESDFFYIIPNVINLNGKGDTKEVFIYTNDNNWGVEQLNGSGKISTGKTNNTLIITSDIDEIFYDIRLKVFSNNIDGKPYDYVTVNQAFKTYNDETDNDLFKINPTYLLFTKQNEVKNVNVTTSCKEGYEVSDLNKPFSLTDNGKGKLSVKYIGDGNTSASTSFNVTSCGSRKKVDIKYDNSFNLQNYLYIISGDTQYSGVTTSLVKNGENDSLGILEYELSSTSKVMVYSKPSQIVASISKLDDNNSCKLRVQFDNNEDFQGQIKLRNNDGIFANINISISGYSDAKGIVFKFNDTNDTNENTKVIEPNENGEYSITIDSYYNKDKSPLNFNIHTNYFDLVPSSTTKPYIPSSTSTTLTFKAKENVKGNKTIQLEEVETFKRLYIKINIDYGNAYYNFYFTDKNGNESYNWYLTYDYQGNLLYEETPMYSGITSLSGSSLSGSSLNDINKEVSFTPSGYSKEELGIISGLTGSTNYTSSFTFTQDGSNNTIILYVTQISEEKCNVEINYDSGNIEISTPLTIDKCFENINDFKILHNNVSILGEDCNYSYSSLTLTQGTDYELTFEPSGENQSNEEREIQVTLQGKGIYSDLTSSFTMTQDVGPCFDPYYQFCIYTSATFTECLSSETVSHNTSSYNYNVTIISRYYTAETSYDTINFTLSTNDSWIHINGTNYSLDLNDTTSERSGSITYKQNGSNYEVYLYITQKPSNIYVIDHGGDGSSSYSKTFCLNERKLAGHIICSTNGSYVEPKFNDILGIDEDGITIDFDTPSGTSVPFYFTLTKMPNQSTITPTFCHPNENGGCVFFEITATVNNCDEPKTCIKLVHGAQPFCYNQTSYAGGLDFELFEGDNCQSYVESAPTSSIVLITNGNGCNLQGGRIEYEPNQTGRIFEYDWIGGENTSANSRYITFIASSTTWNCSGTCTLEQYGTAHTECDTTEQTCMNIEYSVPVPLSSSVIVSFKDSSGAIIASHTVPSTTGTTTKEICDLTNRKALTASCSDDTVTMSGGINFNFSAGTTEYITVQAPNSGTTGSTSSTCVISETITSNGGTGTKVTVGKGETKTLTIYTKENGMFSMVSVVPDIYDDELVTISNTASSQTEYHTTWLLTASNSKTGSTDITFNNGCGSYVLPFEVTSSTASTDACVTPTIKFSTTNTWSATNANSTVSNVQFCDDGVSVTRSHTFNYPSSNMGQYQTFGIDFSINDVACTIQSIEASNDSGNETTGGGSLGFSYTDINPDLILSDGSFIVSGTFVYINGQGLTKNGTYSITIYIQEV